MDADPDASPLDASLADAIRPDAAAPDLDCDGVVYRMADLVEQGGDAGSPTLITPELVLADGTIEGRQCETVLGSCDPANLHVHADGLGVEGPDVNISLAEYYSESVLIILDPPRAIEYELRFGDGSLDQDGDGLLRHSVSTYRDTLVEFHELPETSVDHPVYVSARLPVADRVRLGPVGQKNQTGEYDGDAFQVVSFTACRLPAERTLSSTSAPLRTD